MNDIVRNELPMVNPIITSYLPYAAIFSIFPNYKESESWIYNNFINIWNYYIDGSMPLRLSSWNIMEICPFLSYNILSQDFVNYSSKSIIDFIISSISSKYYIFLPVDLYYIPISPFFKKKHVRHTPLIYGFDNNNKVFKIADFFKFHKFSFEEVKYTDLENAATKMKKIPCPKSWKSDFTWFDVVLFKYKENQKYTFDINIVINSIYNYINSRHSVLPTQNNILGEGELSFYFQNKLIFGMDNYKVINEAVLSNIKKRSAFTEIRALHALYDHKVYILSLIDYLNKNNHLKNSDIFINKFTEIRDICFINRNLLVKYQSTFNKKYLYTITNNYMDIAKKEISLFNELLLNIY